jgi:hypothetical protein
MSMTEEIKKSWTETDVKALIGQSESIRRDYKAGLMFDREPEGKWVKELSIEVSAFANTEGGDLILGIDEDKKSKPRVASVIDGVSAALAPERLQQLIEGNVSPYLPGIRVHRVKLSAPPGRVVFVIQVPQGSTAYQANDGRYYGRSEFEAKYLRDHEIRLRMSRGKTARAGVHLRLLRVTLGADHEAELRAKHAPAIEAFKTDAADAVRRFPELLDLMMARYHPDEISFDLVLRNDGELTIREPVVKLREARAQQLLDGWTVQSGSLSARLEMRGNVIYPGDDREIAGSGCHLRCKREAALAVGDYVVCWKVFLENSPPSAGEIDVGSEIQSARR